MTTTASALDSIKPTAVQTTSGSGNPMGSVINSMKTGNEQQSAMIKHLTGGKYRTFKRRKYKGKKSKSSKKNKSLYKRKKTLKRKIKRIRKMRKYGGASATTTTTTATTPPIIAPTLNISYKGGVPASNPQSAQSVSNNVNSLLVKNQANALYDGNTIPVKGGGCGTCGMVGGNGNGNDKCGMSGGTCERCGMFGGGNGNNGGNSILDASFNKYGPMPKWGCMSGGRKTHKKRK